MEIGDISLIHGIEADAISLSRSGSHSQNAGELRASTEQFEAILIRQYLSEALKPLFSDSLMGQASGSHLYQYMITDALASELSKDSTFGIASLLQMQLTQAEGLTAKNTI
jgi:Rod binding domain-containing protein